MSFLERMRRLSEHVAKAQQHVRSEDDTKQYLVLPFFEALGYCPFDPTQIWREHNPESLHAGQTRTDYMILKDGKRIVAVECKTLDHALGQNEITQLAGYYTFDDATIGVLTDGVKYRFFADKAKTNVMDEHPFYDFDIGSFEDAEVEVIEWLTKSSFSRDLMLVAAEEYRERLDTDDSPISEVATEEPREKLVEQPQIENNGGSESMRERLDKIIKDILRDTVNIALVRTEDSRSMLSVHLDANTLGGKTTRFFRLVKKSDWCSLEFTDTQRSASGGWERGSRKMSRFAKIKDMDDLYNYADTIQERAARFYSPNGRA